MLLGIAASVLIVAIFYGGLNALFGDDLSAGLLDGLALGVGLNVIISCMLGGSTAPVSETQAS